MPEFILLKNKSLCPYQKDLTRSIFRILRILQENARLTTKELAARVSLSSTPVFERLKRLESGGYIKKIHCRAGCRKAESGFRCIL